MTVNTRGAVLLNHIIFETLTDVIPLHKLQQIRPLRVLINGFHYLFKDKIFSCPILYKPGL